MPSTSIFTSHRSLYGVTGDNAPVTIATVELHSLGNNVYVYMNILNCSCSDRLDSLAPFILRVVVGAVFVMHGIQKLSMGVDGVAGFLGGMGFPVPVVMAVLLIAAEVVGGAFLIVGLFTHWVAKLLAFVALIAALTVHITKGFYVSEGGYEFALLLFAAAVSLAITGAGRWSLDSARKK